MDNSDRIIANARAMTEAVAKGIGPEVVIVVNATAEQAAFWQERLTGLDNIHGSGAVLRRDAVVLSVTESNWDGGAGNALGTLNGFLQAARKAAELGIIPAGKDTKGEVSSLGGFCSGKSAFMFHTAGKGTRIAPLPASECNSKSNIKLPGLVKVSGREVPVTMLESIIKVTGIYAPSRKGRLSVFWGDQVIINENDIAFDGRHHVEIFGQLVPLDEDIKSYGLLIPGKDGDCSQREKLDIKKVKELCGSDENKVYRSIGSFTVSLSILVALIEMESHFLENKKGALNTDPDWWQPLTSGKDEYIRMMNEKRTDAASAGAKWEEVSGMWLAFSASEAFRKSGLSGKVGFKDVGENSLWWDYGQNAYFLKNMELLVKDTEEGKTARVFFDAEKYFIKSEKRGDLLVENSLIMRSSAASGKIRSCVVVASELDEVHAEDSVVIGSDIIELNAEGALCYNVVSKKEDLGKGEVAVNIFHPRKGKISLRTDISRDGHADWESGEKILGNLFAYPEIAEMMKGVKPKESEQIRDSAIKEMRG